MWKIPSFPILYCVNFLKTPGAKSWEPGSNGAVEPGYFEACPNPKAKALHLKTKLHFSANPDNTEYNTIFGLV